MRCLAPFKKDTPQKITRTEFALGVLQIFRSNSNGRLKTNDWVSLLSPKTKTKYLCYQRPRPVRYHPGLYRFRYRDYSPTLGRWTSLDPIRYEAGDVNLYRTFFNAPTVYVDPFGLDNDIPDAVAVPLPGPLLPVQNNLLPHISRQWQRLVQECDLIFDGESWQAVGGRGLLLEVKANVNAIATTARSLVTLGIWAEPWEVWAVDDADRPFYEGGFLAARFGWELLPTAGIGKLTQAPGQMGRWGRWALGWDAGQNAVQASRGGYDIYENGLTWTNGLQVVGSLLGLGGNYATWRRLPAGGAAPRTWQDFLPEAQMRLQATKAKYGNVEAQMMAMSRKDALKRLNGLTPKIEEHLQKIANDPMSRDLPHWTREVENWIRQMEKVLPYIGDKTAAEWAARIAEWKARIAEWKARLGG